MASQYKRNRLKTIDRNLVQYGQHTCEICGKAPLFQYPKELPNGVKGFQLPHLLTIDHIVPVAKGGKDGLYNLRVACRECNMTKGDS